MEVGKTEAQEEKSDSNKPDRVSSKLSIHPKVQFAPDESLPSSPSFGSPIKSRLRTRKRKRTLSEASYFSTSSRTSSVRSVSSSSSSSSSYSIRAPDGGWGWVVVVAAFFVNLIADGITFSFGLLYMELEEEFGHSKAVTAGVVGLFHAVPLLSGPISSALTDRFGCKQVTLAGSILSCVGFLLTAFSESLEVIYVTCGLLSGFGLSLCYVAALVVVAYYFDTKRSLATGISVCGSGVGTLVFAPFIEFLIELYGWRGTMIILAGCFLNMCVCGMFFRDLEWTRTIHNNRKNASVSPSKSLGNISTASKTMPEVEELKLLLENGDVSALFAEETQGGQDQEERLSSSLIHIPTYLSNLDNNEDKVNQVVNAICENEMTRKFFIEKFPESSIAQSLESETQLPLDHNPSSKKATLSTDDVADQEPLLTKKVDDRRTSRSNHSKFRGPLEIQPDAARKLNLDDDAANEVFHPEPLDKSNKNDVQRTSQLSSSKSRGQVDPPQPVEHVVGGTKLKRKVSSLFKKSNPKPILKKAKDATDEVTHQEPLLDKPKKVDNQRTSHLNHLKFRRQSVTYRGAMLSTSRYRLRACNSCPDIYQNAMIVHPSEEESGVERCGSWVKDNFFKYCFCISCGWKKFLDISFTLFLISNFILYAWYDIMYTYLPDYAEKTLQWHPNDATILLPMIGIFNTLGEVVIGYVGDKNWINLNYLYALCMAACGVCTLAVPFISGHHLLRAMASVFGFAISANYSLTSPILVELVSIEDFSNAYGLLLLVQGISNLVGPPFAGYLYDVTLQWYLTFGIGGAFIAFSGLLVTIVPFFHHFRKPPKTSNQVGEITV